MTITQVPRNRPTSGLRDPANNLIGRQVEHTAKPIQEVWAGRAQNRLQARLLALETDRERERLASAKRAQLRASIINKGAHSNRLVVANQGNGEARAIRVTVDGLSLMEHRHVSIREGEVVTELRPAASVSYTLVLTMSAPPVFDVAITWEDDTLEPGRWRSPLGTL